MDRLFTRAAAIALCTSWAVACVSAANADDAKKPAASTDVSAGSTESKTLPSDLEGNIRRAQLLRTQGNYDEASRALSQLMLVAQDDPRVVSEYGKVLVQQGRPGDALAFLKRAVEIQPNDWTLYSALGVAYDQLDDHKNARAAYEHALSLNPANPVVLNNYAVSRMLAGDTAGAQPMLEQAQARGVKDPKIANNLQMAADIQSAKAAPAHAKPVIQPTVQAATPPAAQPTAAKTGVAANTSKPLPSTVVMQQIPIDPQAGPVAPATHPPRKLGSTAIAAKPKAVVAHVAEKKTTPPPSLRASADGLRADASTP